MSHKMLRPCIVKVFVLGYFPLHDGHSGWYVDQSAFKEGFVIYIY